MIRLAIIDGMMHGDDEEAEVVASPEDGTDRWHSRDVRDDVVCNSCQLGTGDGLVAQAEDTSTSRCRIRAVDEHKLNDLCPLDVEAGAKDVVCLNDVLDSYKELVLDRATEPKNDVVDVERAGCVERPRDEAGL